MKILVFMSDNRMLSDDFETAKYNSLAAAINLSYCKKHGYDFKYYRPLYKSTNDVIIPSLYTCLDPNTGEFRHASWNKLLSAMIAMTNEQRYDYVVYIDSDCIFRDFNTSIESKIGAAPVNTEIMFLNDKPWFDTLPCGGFFIAACTQNVYLTIKNWYGHNIPEKNRQHPWEQAALVDLYPSMKNTHIFDDWMFIEKEGQWLRHMCHLEETQRVPYFKNVISTQHINFENMVNEIADDMYVKYDSMNILKQLYNFIGYNTIANIRPKKVLVTILTSSDIDILEVCVRSITRQTYVEEFKKEVTFHPVIIVNTKIPGYFEAVQNKFRGEYNIPVIMSESNGRPGKGHNSEIEYFQTHSEYDWMIPVDGDDALYPTAMWQLASLVMGYTSDGSTPQFDVLFYLGLDTIKWNSAPGNISISKGTFLNTIFKEDNIIKTEHIANPYSDLTLDQIMCPVRTCLLNRRAANISSPTIHWDEDGVLLEDYPPFLAAFEHHLLGNLQIAGTSNRYIYLYNQLTINNVTTKYVNETKSVPANFEAANATFKRSIAEFKNVKENWNEIRNIPFVRMATIDTFRKSIPEKIDFVNKTFVAHYFHVHLKKLEELYAQKQWVHFIIQTKVLIDTFPELIQKPLIALLYMNLGECYFHQGELSNAKIHWNVALQNSQNQEQQSAILKNLEVCDQGTVRV